MILGHPSSVIFVSATLSVMVFEPTGMAAIPEFGVFLALVAGTAFLVLELSGRRHLRHT